jgi:predicted trehalose synthase
VPKFQLWMRYWNRWVSTAFLKAYFQKIAEAEILPANEDDIRVMLRAHLLDRMMDELGEHLREKDKWLSVPLQGIILLMTDATASPPATEKQPAAAAATH